MFTGRRFDAETELYYYRARYYEPKLGRFLQTDPIGIVMTQVFPYTNGIKEDFKVLTYQAIVD